jgi:K+-transporting ATPase KdpF subunit
MPANDSSFWTRIHHVTGIHRDQVRGAPSPENALRRTKMIFDYALAGLVSAGLLFYLTYALLRPERF